MSGDTFLLDYGDGSITVEFDAGDYGVRQRGLLEGDDVMVYGIIDEELFDIKTIEASSLCIERLDLRLRSAGLSPESGGLTFTTPVAAGTMTVSGPVTEVADNEFTLDLGPRNVVIHMNASAVIDDGAEREIEVNDVVSVTVDVDYDFLEASQLTAQSVEVIEARDN
jgi:hypothetical protein